MSKPRNDVNRTEWRSGLANYYGEVLLRKDDQEGWVLELENWDGAAHMQVSEAFAKAWLKEFQQPK